MSVTETVVSDDDMLNDVFASDRDRGADFAAPEPETDAKPEQHAEPEGEAEPVKAEDEDDGSSKQYRDPETGRFVPLTELKTERQKRQDAERLRDEANQRAQWAYEQLQRVQQPQQQPSYQDQQHQLPDPVLEPEEYINHRLQAQQVEYQQREYQRAVMVSDAVMRAQHEDYDEMVIAGTEAAKSDPYLMQQILNHPLPGQAAYLAGQRIKAMQEFGPDPAAYKANLEKQIREQVLAELKAGGQGQQQPRFPGTLGDQPSSGNGRVAQSEEAMLAELFASDRRRGAT